MTTEIQNIGYDFSTLNLELLRELPVLELRPTWYVQMQPGVDCFLDPPGYPSYFLRQVYDFAGDPVDGGLVAFMAPEEVLHHVCEPSYEALFPFWRPVPMGSLRFMHWERTCYLALAGSAFLLDEERDQVELLQDIDFTKFPELLKQHAAFFKIKIAYPDYQLNEAWAFYNAHRAPHDQGMRSLERGFFWQKQWIACQTASGKEIVHGWERTAL